MGLDEFNIAPDNKGGRPEKTEDNEEPQDYFGPSHDEYSSEEYWESLLEDNWNGSEITFDAMKAMCAESHMLPQSVVSKLVDNDIVDTDQLGEYLDMYEHETNTPSFSSGSSYSDSGTLSSIIDAAK